MKWINLWGGVMLVWLYGCATNTPPAVVEEESMIHLGANLRPENLLFPEYLFMTDFELDQHGRVPKSSWVGAGLKTKLGLQVVFQRFNDVLAFKGWKTTVLESSKHAFRLRAALKEDTLEVRGVQGTGPTQVFILYRPTPVEEKAQP